MNRSGSGRPPRLKNRTFGIVVAAFLLFLGIVRWLSSDAIPIYLFATSAVMTALALSVPGILMPFNRIGNFVVKRLVILTNTVCLGIAYWVAIVPAGMIAKAFGRDTMGRQWESGIESYWERVGRQTTKETLRDQF